MMMHALWLFTAIKICEYYNKMGYGNYSCIPRNAFLDYISKIVPAIGGNFLYQVESHI